MSLNTGNAILSNAITVDGSYNVGIGTTPSYKLDVNGTGRFSGLVRVDGQYVQIVNASNPSLYLSNTTVQWQLKNNSSNNLVFNDGAADRITFAYGGAATFSSSVTAGTAFYGFSSLLDPSTSTNLGSVYSLNGNSPTNPFGIGVGAVRNGAYDIFFQTGPVNGGGYRWYIGTSEKMTMSSSGNVGIGTSSPAAQLEIKSGTSGFRFFTSTSTSAQMNLLADLGGGYDNAGSILAAQESTNNSYLAFGTKTSGSLTEKMRITSAGKVCINTTSSNNGWLAVQGAYGAAAIDARGSAGEWTYYGIASSTSGSSNGLLLFAGTTSADVAVLIKNQSGSSEYFQIRGDGLILSPSTYNYTTASAANMNIGTAGDFRRSTSSIKYKTDVNNYDKGLAEVMQMRPVYYKGINDGDTQFAGLIAEEVHDLGLTEFVQYAEDGTPDALAYQNMIALLTKAIQEQQVMIEKQQEQINQLINK